MGEHHSSNMAIEHFVLTGTATATIIGFTVAVFVHYGNALFVGHPISMIGATVAMLTGISTYRIGGAATSLATIRKRHALTMTLTCLAGVVGISIILANKRIHNKPITPSSWHATL